MKRAPLVSLCSVLLAVGLSASASAQSTAFGKILYAPDRWWSSAREHNWQLRTWDDTENKSAAMSGAIVYFGGLGLAKVTPSSVHRSREVLAGMYVLRAVYGLASGETHRYRAHAKHVFAATAAATISVRFRL